MNTILHGDESTELAYWKGWCAARGIELPACCVCHGMGCASKSPQRRTPCIACDGEGWLPPDIAQLPSMPVDADVAICDTDCYLRVFGSGVISIKKYDHFGDWEELTLDASEIPSLIAYLQKAAELSKELSSNSAEKLDTPASPAVES